jgi:hypothetical protein
MMSSNNTALTMIFKLGEAAEKSWRRINSHNQSPKSSVNDLSADLIRAFAAKPAYFDECLSSWITHYDGVHTHKVLGYRSPHKFIAADGMH